MKKNILLLICLTAAISAVASANEEGQQFQGFNLQGYNDRGEKSWVVNGDTADIIGNDIKISNVDADIFGDEKINITSDTGMINKTEGKMRLRDDVVITSERGLQMVTDSLDWEKDKDLVSTEDDVLITDEGLIVTGTGMTAHPAMKLAKINEDVTATVDTQPKSADDIPITITCDGPMEIDQSKSFATFEDNVVAVQQDQSLKADRVEVYFDKEMGSIKEMICIGNVEIIRGDNKTYAERAVYTAETQKLVLTGRPKLILITEGDNAITSFGN